MGAVTCVDPMALAPTPPILRTTLGFDFCNEPDSGKRSLFHEIICLVKKQQRIDGGCQHQNSVPYILPSPDLPA
jgi:hypothetical protein